MRRIDQEAGRVDPLAQEIAHPRLPGQFLQQGLVLADQPQLVLDPLEPDPAIAAHQFRDVGRQIGRQREFAEAAQNLDHLLGGHAGGGRIPQGERGKPIGMDMLRALLQLGEGSEGVAGLGVAGLSTSTRTVRSPWTMSGLAGS